MRGHVDQLVDRCVRNAEAARSKQFLFFFEKKKRQVWVEKKEEAIFKFIRT
jgi:hypothetical protein